MSSDDGMGEKLKGVAKEATGRAIGDEDLQREGEAQQKKAHDAAEAQRLEEEARAKRAEAADHAVDERAHRD
jgi:uncharacterized protein YjbJ (UPF0337 family)